MNGSEKYLVRLRFKVLIHESNGQAFENLFTQIMKKNNKDFQLVKAHGNIGDMKNDGFDRVQGRYYQVYGPEDIKKDKTIKDAVNKLNKDFNGLLEYWNTICPIKFFHYVVNDKYNGIPGPIHQGLITLEKENPTVECRVFSSADLEDELFKLDIDNIRGVIGYLPDTDIGILDYSVLNEVIDHVMNAEVSFDSQPKLVVPDFYEKIIFNSLSDRVKDFLVTANYSSGSLEEYFAANSKHIRKELETKMSDFYEESKVEIPESQEDYPDKRFYFILEKCCPNHSKAVVDAALVLMSYFFETCDIFEEPIKG
ncbi:MULTISPECIES: ABC-three component system protein [Bacillus]|uniref:ABC-three component system protein n=1 Tax=Bacillus TaxID=1386 RepID=UPI0029C45BA5|nr:ABC-three component system protein [Bacillus paranthracis]MDX6047612.1 ABC-three component system protein [Bacillus paranthracis]